MSLLRAPPLEDTVNQIEIRARRFVSSCTVPDFMKYLTVAGGSTLFFLIVILYLQL